MAKYSNLPDGCSLRAATATDMWAIRRLVLFAMLDPSQLQWQQFWVIDRRGKIVACTQLRSFPDAQELGSLAVARSWRGRGLGTALALHVIERATRPLYLECLGPRLVEFYARLGFSPVALAELPDSLKVKFAFTARVAKLLGLPLTLMQYQKGTRMEFPRQV